MNTLADEKLLAEWFWIDRWMGSSAFLLPLEHRGLYREMLSQAWRRNATLPNDHEAIRRAVGCTKQEWKRCWPKIERFWVVDGETLHNETQRAVYGECLARSESLSERGRKGGLKSAAKRKPGFNSSSTQVQPSHQPTGQANGQLTGKPPEPDLEPFPPPQNGGGRAPADIRLPKGAPGSSLQWHRLHGTHVSGFCDWKCLMADDFAQFSNRLPGGEAEALAWAKSVRASGIVPTGKPWTFWNEQFDAAFGPVSKPAAGGFSAADWAAHMPGGAIDRKLGIS